MAEKKRALGRGLDALFGDMEMPVPVRAEGDGAKQTRNAGAQKTAKTAQVAPENTIHYIDIDEIKPNAMQPRQTFEPSAIEELANSIEVHGVIQPITLRKADIGYELVMGERRWRAARKAGIKKIPAIIRAFTDEENALVALIENTQRTDLNTIEEARAFRTIIEKYGMTQEALSRSVGKSRPHIANTLRTLKFPDEIIAYLQSGVLTLGHANALGAIKDSDLQLRAAEKIAKTGLSVRESERLCSTFEKKGDGSKKHTKITARGTEIKAVEEELTTAIGTKVSIKPSGKGGNVELRYYDKAGLDELIDLLRGAGKRR